MKVVIVKNNSYIKYNLLCGKGYTFKPKKSLNNLNIININMIKTILKKRIDKDINNAKNAIRLMLKSDFTEISDCNMMIKELKRLSNNLENKYRLYFNEMEYFELVKQIYQLDMEINTKRILLETKD